ncbi:hypothetical protein ACWFRT_05240 [Streptomyces anulatus]
MVTQVHQHLPEREAALLVRSRLWPLIAARMRTLDADHGIPLGPHLARIAPDTAAWRDGPPSGIAARLLLAAHHALTTPLDQALPTGPRVSTTAARSRSTTAARSRSTTTVPDTAPPKQPAPAEPAAPAHRQHAAPAPRQGHRR